MANDNPLLDATFTVEEVSDKGWGLKIKGSGKTYTLTKTIKSTGAPSKAFQSLGSQPPEVGQTYAVKFAEVPYEYEGKSGMSKYIRMIAKASPGATPTVSAPSDDNERFSKLETRVAFLEGKLGVDQMREPNSVVTQTASPGDDNYIDASQIPF